MAEYDYTNTYWNDKGKHNEQAKWLGSLIPDKGRSENHALELFRCATNVYHDIYNNGGCNLENSKAEEVYYVLYTAEGDDCPDNIRRFILNILQPGGELPEHTNPSAELEQVMDWVIEYCIDAQGIVQP